MVVWRPESIFSNQPPRWENNEIKNSLARIIWLHSQHCEDGWIWVIERDGSHSVEVVQIVLVGVVVSVPGHHIEWRVILFINTLNTTKLGNYMPLLVRVFIPSDWSLEVTLIGKAIWSDWAKVWDRKVALINFTHPTASSFWAQVDREFDTAWNHTNLLAFDLKSSKFCFDAKLT